MDEIKEVIQGTFIQDAYRDFKTGYAIFSLLKGIDKRTGNWDTILVKSKLTIAYRTGTPLKIEGAYDIEKNIFEAASIEQDSGNHEELVKYIINSKCPGVGVSIANKIVNAMPDFFEEIKDETAVEKIKKCGVNEESAKNIRKFFNKENVQLELITFIKKHNGTYAQANRLYDKYQEDSLNILKSNTYSIAEEIGMSLDSADSIASSSSDSSFASRDRIDFIINRVSDRVFNQEGNTYILTEDFIKAVSNTSSKVFNQPIPALNISIGLMHNKLISLSNDYVYSKYLNKCEEIIVREIIRLNSFTIETPIDWNIVSKIEKENGYMYAKQQKWAFTLAETTGIKILTGGPGTGKTTTVDGFIRYFEHIFRQSRGREAIVKLCAPTGRAAQRITEQTKRRAFTIHQLLEFKPFGDSEICKSMEDPIDADLIIVDEMSMTDVTLFSLFLQAVKKGTTIILVGDVNQLASVGPGNVLKDLIDCGYLQMVMLTDVYRQASDSNIVGNAAKINAGNLNLIEGDDFKIINVSTESEVQAQTQALIKSYYKKNDPFYVQLLCPTHAGVAGVDMSNKNLQQCLNDSKDKFTYGGKSFKTGDKIIMMKNRFAKGYCNGDVGTVEYILKEGNSKKGLAIRISDTLVEISGESLEDIELSYSMTIHKSQGSEYPIAVIAMPLSSPIMLKRNLLYTGVTRAKKKAYIINQGDAMQTAIVTPGTGLRNTWLTKKLKKRFYKEETGA